MTIEDPNLPFLVRIVDDDPIFCDAITYMLELEGWEVKTYSSAMAFLRDDMPSRDGVLLLDINMPQMNGVTLQQELVQRGYAQPIIFITAHGNVDVAVETLRKGAFHFLQKPVEPTALLNAIAQAYEHIQDKKVSIESSVELRKRIDSLTQREKEVAELLAQGLLNGDIAKKLHLSVRTVEQHHAHIYTKLGVKQVAAVARIWKRYCKQFAEDHSPINV